jgi:poly-gamma-glutamate synthesis protein (capsule biosynthesis protein)
MLQKISNFPKNYSSKSPFFLLVIFFVFILSIDFIFLTLKNFETELSLAQISVYLRALPKPVTLFFVGDIMLDRGVEAKIKKYGQGDWKFPFLKIADTLKKSDILFGNLEGPISDKGRNVGSIYSFRADPKAIEGLNYAGFDILSVANNHFFDYTISALEDTFLRLKEANIDYAGGGFNEEEAYAPVIKEIKGVKIAFLAYTNLGSPSWQAGKNRSGIAWLTKERLEEGVKSARKQADIVIVSFHFGDEYQNQSNAVQKYFAHLAIDSGANLVVGHHPHVVQEIEKYNKGYIAYSLGNFIFDQNFSKETMEGLLLKVLVEDKKIKEVLPLNVKINEFFQPEIVK